MTAAAALRPDVRARLLARLRALMARTVANGATEQEELVAARMVAKMIGQLDEAPAPPPRAEPPPNWAQAERDSQEYKQLLAKNTTEALLKAAVQELALNHINTVSPPRRRLDGEPVERVTTRELLEPYLAMMLAPGGTQLAGQIIRQTIDELVYDGALPPWLDLPLTD
ncbi:MAG TPA: hypothetical protein VLL76_09900 [Candidatus Omnitrophota bacterium]|nr:hypothetical protein [Candidatus Omnitrophota bacterium]